MTQREELVRFVEAARAKGLTDASISALLEANGWPGKEVAGALREHYEAVIGVPVPVRRSAGESARDAFLHLLGFGTLATWTIALGGLLFGLIERTWPDQVMQVVRADTLSAANLASLLVAFPIYLLASRQTMREMADAPEKRESGVRRWLTWIALLIAASVVIGDLIAVLTELFRGEITVRFLLKAFVVLVLAGGVFWFYSSDIRDDRARARPFLFAACLAVVAGLAAGFTGIGSPAKQRTLEADRRRVTDLRAYVAVLRPMPSLPESLSELRIRKGDPETGLPYEYRRLGGTRFQLCATFDNEESRAGFWSHGSGRQCFELDTSAPLPAWPRAY